MKNDVFGFVRPENDIHTLGIATISGLLEDCGYTVCIGNSDVVRSVINIHLIESRSFLKNWIEKNNITKIGFSYRLDPNDGQKIFGKFYNFLISERILQKNGGQIERVYFAGLPKTCLLIDREYNGEVITFIGDETSVESLIKLGVPKPKIKNELLEGTKYDNFRIDFAKDFINTGTYQYYKPIKNLNYPNCGTRKDTLKERLLYHRKKSILPLTRVHVGPYNENRNEAIKLFKEWLKTLSETGFLDIVSIGSSQLSQSSFGEDWAGRQNGGGVPVNSRKELIEIYEAGRPMLMRIYSGTNRTQEMAQMFEETINICWHALSFWWFNKLDGRGPHDVKTNLKNHLETLKIISKHNKPFEPNIPHHFSFRGGDDVTYVLSSYLACLTAKKIGVKEVVLQVMLNTPKATWGVQDLAKARALLKLVKELEDKNFKVYLQPRAGLDYFSPDLEKAKIQLATVSAMMDDIEPNNPLSPEIVHIVSYCEAVELATPSYINESIQITLASIEEYRRLKEGNRHIIKELNLEVQPRADELYNTVKTIHAILEKRIENLYSYEGLYQVLKKGVLNAPYLWEGREEFSDTVKYKTRIINGGVKLVDNNNNPLDIIDKIKESLDQAQW